MLGVRADRWWFAGLAFVVCVYIVSRAALVPLVHDEGVSFIAYAQGGRFLPFASMWDANNHFLNSLCGHLGYRLFGLHPLALRWASVLSYVLYAWCAWRIGGRIEHSIVRWLLWGALLACPFLLDFFSLFRGYGPATALVLLTLLQALRYNESRATKHLGLSLLALMAACGFMLALLPLACVLLVLFLFVAWRNPAHLALWMMLGAVPWVMLALLARHMADLGLLYHGGHAGYIETTIGSLLQYALGLDGTHWRVMAIVLVVAMSGALLLLPRRTAKVPLLIIAAALWGEFLLRVVLASSAGLNYAEDRAALHVLVLAMLFLAFTADGLRKHWSWSILLALPLAAFPIRSAFTANVDRTALWPEQSIPSRFIARIEALEGELGRPSVVGMHRLATLPYGLHRRMRGGEGDGTALAGPCGAVDAWIAFGPVQAQLGCGFVVADSSSGTGLRLLLREQPLREHVAETQRFSLRMTQQERSSGFAWDAMDMRRSATIAEIKGRIQLDVDGSDLRVAIAVWDSAGLALHGDHVLLATRRGAWHGEEVQIARPIPILPGAARAEVFLWSVDRAPSRLSEGVLRLHAVE